MRDDVKPKRAVCYEIVGNLERSPIRSPWGGADGATARGGGSDDSDSVVGSEEVVCKVLGFDP